MESFLRNIQIAIIVVSSFLLGYLVSDIIRDRAVGRQAVTMLAPYYTSTPGLYTLPDTSRVWTYADDQKLADFEARLIIVEAEIKSFKAWKMRHGR